jgi:hypothetical protein
MPGSTTTPGLAGARDCAPVSFAFHQVDSVGTQYVISIAAQWLACRTFRTSKTHLGANFLAHFFAKSLTGDSQEAEHLLLKLGELRLKGLK